jgi:hypothetical protein
MSSDVAASIRKNPTDVWENAFARLSDIFSLLFFFSRINMRASSAKIIEVTPRILWHWTNF